MASSLRLQPVVWHSRPRLWISVSDFADDAIPVIPPYRSSTPKNKDLADSTPGLVFRSRRSRAMSAIPAIPAISSPSPLPGYPTPSQVIPVWRALERDQPSSSHFGVHLSQLPPNWR